MRVRPESKNIYRRLIPFLLFSLQCLASVSSYAVFESTGATTTTTTNQQVLLDPESGNVVELPKAEKKSSPINRNANGEKVKGGKKQVTKIPESEKRRLHRQKIRDLYRKRNRNKNKETSQSDETKNSENRESERRRMNSRNSFQPNKDTLIPMASEEVNKSLRQPRHLWGNTQVDAYDLSSRMADPSQEYDMWQQAYRTVGAFIDCDHVVQDSHDSGNNDGMGCSRWMMWAAYVDPYYQGNGYAEYYNDDDTGSSSGTASSQMGGSLDCHEDGTGWLLLGVYRQEFYQYLEQISKHLWADGTYEYTVALSTLEYIGEDNCEAVGYDENGYVIYAGIQPMELGDFQMGLYLEEDCLYPQDPDSFGYTFDDFFEADDRFRRLDGDENGGDDDYYSWWNGAQEYTLTYANEVYEPFKYCTLCIDYPTYQDGEINGDSGYDDDDLINQCWKFYSHDTFTCGSECIRNGHRQGGMTNLKYGSNYFGTIFYDGSESLYSSSSGSSSSSQSSSATMESKTGRFSVSPEKLDRLKANVFVTFAGILFIATFLAFAVATSNRDIHPGKMIPRRRRRKRDKSSEKKALGLLDEYAGGKDSARRSKRRSGEHRSKSNGRRGSKGRGERSKGRSKSVNHYEPPQQSPGSSSPHRKRPSSHHEISSEKKNSMKDKYNDF